MKDVEGITSLDSKNHQSSSATGAEENNEQCVQTIHLGKGAKEAEIHEAAAAVTNGAASVILEGVDASLLFPQGVDRDGSLTVQWEGNKDIVLQSDGSSPEGSVLFSQAHTLVELLHELFRPSDSPMQIILEPQVCVEKASSGLNSVADESGIPRQEIKISESNIKPQAQDVKKNEKLSFGASSDSKHPNQLENQNYKTDPLPSVQLIHRCFYCSFGSETFSFVLDHVKNQHPNKPTKTKTISGRNCPYCGIRLHQTAFFQHMRQYHGDAHPFRCGYCNFMGRDLNQLKHHCSKKHRDKSFKGFRRLIAEPCQASNVGSEGLKNAEDVDFSESAPTFCGVSEKGDNVEAKEEDIELVDSLENKLHSCPVCQKKLKTLKYLKVHMRVHSKGRYKCGYCSYLSAYCLQALLHCKKRHRHLQPRVKQHELDPMQNKNVVKNYEMFMEEVRKKCSRQPPDPDTRKWARKYSCPHCEYTCSYGASYRRHLTTHTTKPLPFRCNYCKFEGREKYYVRRHIQRIHRGYPAVVVDNKPEEPSKSVPEDQENVSTEFCSVAVENVETHMKAIPHNLGKREEYPKITKAEEVRGNVCMPAKLVMEKGDLGVRTDEGTKDEEKALPKRTEGFENGCEISNETSYKVVISSVREEIVPVGPECLGVDVMREKDGESSNPQLCEGTKRCVAQQCSSKTSKKQSQKGMTYRNFCNGKQDAVILPKGGPVDYLKVGVESEKIQEQDTACDGLPVVKDPVGICLENLLGVVEAEKCEGFADCSVEDKSCGVIVADCKKGHVEDSAKVKDVIIKASGKKKGNKEKSAHKAWDFVAYRDGRHTFCVCGARTVNKAFYKHIKKHNESKRFGCGYCSYRSIERAKIRVHHTFVHPGLPLNVNESEENSQESAEKSQKLNPAQIPWSSDNNAKCVPPSNSKKDSPSSNKVSAHFHCPICKKKISYHTYTIRRHLFSHCDYRPYKCGRCDFRGCSPGEVKQHSVYHGADLCPLIEPSGQEPPEGLEQLVTDCFKELRTKLGKRTRSRSKANGKTFHLVAENSTKEDFVPHGYQLVTKEASLWNKTLCNGVCPLCLSKIPLSTSDSKELQVKGSQIDKIRLHFKAHFYKPVGDSSPDELRAEAVECLVPTNPPGSLEEKDSIVMNGLMYYFLNQPLMKEPITQTASQSEKPNSMKGETGIINSPDGMPPGTIQVTDSLLADLRHLLWGQVQWPKSRRTVWHTCQKCSLQFKSNAALQLHAESHLKGPERKEEISPYDLQNVSNTPTVLQVSDSEVGVYLLGDDMEVSTAVVVINSEAGENQEMELEESS